MLFRTLIAALPILGFALEAKSGFLLGGATTLLLGGTEAIFLGIQKIVPGTVRKISFFLILIVFGVILEEIFSVPFLVLTSACFLIPSDLFRPRKNGRKMFRKMLLMGLSFWALLLFHGIVMELLGKEGNVWFFQLPAGSYLVLGILVLVWPFKKGKQKR